MALNGRIKELLWLWWNRGKCIIRAACTSGAVFCWDKIVDQGI